MGCTAITALEYETQHASDYPDVNSQCLYSILPQGFPMNPHSIARAVCFIQAFKETDQDHIGGFKLLEEFQCISLCFHPLYAISPCLRSSNLMSLVIRPAAPLLVPIDYGKTSPYHTMLRYFMSTLSTIPMVQANLNQNHIASSILIVGPSMPSCMDMLAATTSLWVSSWIVPSVSIVAVCLATV